MFEMHVTRSQLQQAIGDVVAALRHRHLWMALGTLDIKHRYKRSVIGPFWITLNLAFMILGIGLIYGNVLHTLHSSYIPYLAVGIIVWTFISTIIIEGASTFILEGSLIKGTTLSKIIYISRGVWRNLWILGHNLLILVPIFLVYDLFPGLGILGAIAGLCLVTLLLASSSLLLAVIGARYRDVPPAISGLMQLLFFATPIIWEAESLRAHQWIITYNPLFHVIETVRAPLLEGAFPLASFAVTAALTLLTAGLALVAYGRARNKIVFWI